MSTFVNKIPDAEIQKLYRDPSNLMDMITGGGRFHTSVCGVGLCKHVGTKWCPRARLEGGPRIEPKDGYCSHFDLSGISIKGIEKILEGRVEAISRM